MLELTKKVFGNIMTQEIIGSEPSISEIKIIFEKELVILIKNLDSISKENLKNLLEQQKISQKHINTRPGAMALNQSKIEMFNDYNNRYFKKINEKISTF
ncbi:MAG: hypothetical protein HOA63_01540 [Nitrosopumilus sp.]|jgi:hypothetical protein|nr:hypothetical protein [Nitrosopumilus sp.]|tara:strand:- start:129 stop:428 length:300 start_codon:yes stop_codon:yes gene_type:complete